MSQSNKKRSALDSLLRPVLTKLDKALDRPNDEEQALLSVTFDSLGDGAEAWLQKESSRLFNLYSDDSVKDIGEIRQDFEALWAALSRSEKLSISFDSIETPILLDFLEAIIPSAAQLRHKEFASVLETGHLETTFRLGHVSIYIFDRIEKSTPRVRGDLHLQVVTNDSEANEIIDALNTGRSRLDDAILVTHLPDEQLHKLQEVANRYNVALLPLDSDAEHLREAFSQILPRNKQSGYARLSESRALQGAEGRNLIRFATWLASASGFIVVPSILITSLSLIHAFIVYRIAWLTGRDFDTQLFFESLGMVGSSVTVGYGLRALAGVTLSMIPWAGKVVSGAMLAGVTEELGESALRFFLEEEDA